MLGLYGDNGTETGNYYSGYRDYLKHMCAQRAHYKLLQGSGSRL